MIITNNTLISYTEMELLITDLVDDNKVLYDIDIDITFDLIPQDIIVEMTISNFTTDIQESLYNENNSSLTKSFRYTDLKYDTDVPSSRIIKLKFVIFSNDTTNGVLHVTKFQVKSKNYLTSEYYKIYSNPEFKYSYNTSVKGTLTNSDKNATHIFLNDKFKNILILINENIPINIDWKSINNTDVFRENYGLYYGKTYNDQYNVFPSNIDKPYTPNNVTAFNFINALNKLNDKGSFETNVNYHYIDVDGNYAKTQITQFNNSTFSDLPNWSNNFPPFLLETNNSDQILMSNNSYIVTPLSGPKTNIKDKFIIYDKGVPLADSIITEPLARDITTNNINNDKYKVNHGETISNNTTVNRFVGYYEPLIKNIPMYTPLYYWKDNEEYKSISGNYKFNDDIDQFAMINELMYSKVNENEYILKLKDSTELSVYPMLDEIGLSQTKRNIFSSPWDSDFFIRTLNSTTLYDYETEIVVDNIVIISGQFNNLKSNINGYYRGINIYGSSLSEDSLGFDFNITNLSDVQQNFIYKIKYHSSYRTIEVYSGTTNNIDINSSDSFSIDLTPPNEVKDYIFNEEYTKWSVVFELYDINNNLLDTNDSILVNVYNDVIGLDLINPYGSLGFYQSNGVFNPYYVENEYNFAITVNETYDKLKNVKCIYNLKSLTINQGSELYEGSELYTQLIVIGGIGSDVYDTLLSLDNDVAYNLINQYVSSSDTLQVLRSINSDVTNTKVVEFNNILIPLNELDYNSNEKRVILFESIHNYIIDSSTETIKSGYVEVIHIDRIQELPILYWYPQTDLTNIKNDILKGHCNPTTKEYTGDFVNTAVNISNRGGVFSGTVKVIFSWREDGVTIAQKSTTLDVLDLEKYGVIEFNNITLGPLNINNSPIVTYDYKNYDVKVSTSYIAGSLTSEQKNGYNSSLPNCNI